MLDSFQVDAAGGGRSGQGLKQLAAQRLLGVGAGSVGNAAVPDLVGDLGPGLHRQHIQHPRWCDLPCLLQEGGVEALRVGHAQHNLGPQVGQFPVGGQQMLHR